MLRVRIIVVMTAIWYLVLLPCPLRLTGVISTVCSVPLDLLKFSDVEANRGPQEELLQLLAGQAQIAAVVEKNKELST